MLFSSLSHTKKKTHLRMGRMGGCSRRMVTYTQKKPNLEWGEWVAATRGWGIIEYLQLDDMTDG
jgi:hypothetical protein